LDSNLLVSINSYQHFTCDYFSVVYLDSNPQINLLQLDSNLLVSVNRS
jgi:hypothetical protein